MKKLYKKSINWALKNWMAILNFFIIIISYFIVYDHDEVAFAETILGIWVIISMGYFVHETFIKRPPKY
jgi:hypothetical protein